MQKDVVLYKQKAKAANTSYASVASVPALICSILISNSDSLL